MSLGDSLRGGPPFLPLLSDSSCAVEWTLTPVLHCYGAYHDTPQRFHSVENRQAEGLGGVYTTFSNFWQAS